MTKVHGAHEIRFGYSRQQTVHGSLAARTRGRAARSAGQRRRMRRPERRAQNAEPLQPVRRVPARPRSATPAESVQNELMTTREWQHALYVRDRWQVNTRADARSRPALRVLPADDARRSRHRTDRRGNDLRARGVDIAERAARRPRRQSRRSRASRSARRCSRRASAPSTASTTNTVFRTGYGITYNPLPFSRPLRGFYPLTLAREFNADEPVRLWPRRSRRAFPMSSARTSLGAHPAAELVR